MTNCTLSIAHSSCSCFLWRHTTDRGCSTLSHILLRPTSSLLKSFYLAAKINNLLIYSSWAFSELFSTKRRMFLIFFGLHRLL
ncbi:hypothetical protein FKM82_014364 [Ascaphus truei]